MKALLWVLALTMLVVAACATLARRPEMPARPLCGPDHPPHLGGCDVLAEDHDAVP